MKFLGGAIRRGPKKMVAMICDASEAALVEPEGVMRDLAMLGLAFVHARLERAANSPCLRQSQLLPPTTNHTPYSSSVTSSIHSTAFPSTRS